MGPRAFGYFCTRSTRPRAGHGDRDCIRRECAHPRAASDRLWRHGRYLAQFGPLLPTGKQAKNIASIYRTPLIEVATKCVFTNTNFVSAYRGAGRPEGNYYVERALDLAA